MGNGHLDILIGFDSLEASGYIFEDLQRAGLPADSRFRIVTATDLEAIPAESEQAIHELAAPDDATWRREISPEERSYLSTMLDNARRYAREKEEETTRNAQAGAEELRKAFPGASVDYQVVMASPFDAICEQASRGPCDLIVVGSQNASGLSRFFLGSVSQKVITYCQQPVRIARAFGQRAEGPLRLLVAFDGSDPSRRAIDAIAARQWPAGTKAKVVTVEEPRSTRFFFSTLDSRPTSAELTNAALIKTLGAAAADQLHKAGLDAHAEITCGDPKRVLIELAEQWNADCLLLGAKGHKQTSAHMLGAVATAIASRAHCSVEVIH